MHDLTLTACLPAFAIVAVGAVVGCLVTDFLRFAATAMAVLLIAVGSPFAAASFSQSGFVHDAGIRGEALVGQVIGNGHANDIKGLIGSLASGNGSVASVGQ